MRLLTLLLTLEISMAQQLCQPRRGQSTNGLTSPEPAHASFRFQEE